MSGFLAWYWRALSRECDVRTRGGDAFSVLPLGFPEKGHREKRPKRKIPLHLEHYHAGKYKSTEEIEALMKKYCRVKELGKVRAL